jgi:hypothetical protein
MAHALHQFAQARACIGGEGVPGMAKVVEVDPGQASLPPRQVICGWLDAPGLSRNVPGTVRA